MAIPWLVALKVIPWGDVIEHAPKVLKAARQLLDKQHQRRTDAATPPTTPMSPGGDVIEMPGPTPPEVRALQQRLAAARADLDRLQQTQDQITQTLADLAEQNTRLVQAVELLRKRTRLLMGALVLLALAGLWWAAR
jgi:small-conductance mechanosensitive channel